MRKFIIVLLIIVTAISMTVTTHAVTPKLDIDLPEIPDISGSVKVEVSDNTLDNWFKEHPFKIDFSKVKLWGWN